MQERRFVAMAAKESLPGRRPAIRSPNYPAINLREALAKARVFLDQIGRHPAGLETIAKLWGSTPKSSGFKLHLAALRAFSLLDNAPGGKDRMVRLSGLALDILADYPEGSGGHRSALQRAALSPGIHAELRERYGPTLPADDEVRRYLVRERVFNDRAVGDFIQEYKDTMAFANLDTGSTISSVAQEGGITGGPPVQAKEGDYVQWTNAGVEQSTEPRLVLGFSDDGQWAFVEGTETGLPVSELTVMNPKSDPKPVVPTPVPPANPFQKNQLQPPQPLAPGMTIEAMTLDEGMVHLQWPAELSPDSVRDFEYWVQGLIRRARRKAGLVPDKQGE
jgi:hypothetical protein